MLSTGQGAWRTVRMAVVPKTMPSKNRRLSCSENHYVVLLLRG